MYGKGRYDTYLVLEYPGLTIAFLRRDGDTVDFSTSERIPHPAELSGAAPKPSMLYVLREPNA